MSIAMRSGKIIRELYEVRSASPDRNCRLALP
jgi:hypothetical protein